MAGDEPISFSDILWHIHRRKSPPDRWQGGGNLPWDDPAFSGRMLREHLDESHSAASRTAPEREAQLAWMWKALGLEEGASVLDATCGPGLYAVPLAEQGCHVTGVDFSPAAIAHAEQLAGERGVGNRCKFIEQDIREFDPGPGTFDAALLLYGQLAVFPEDEARALLATLAGLLRPGGRLCLELPDEEALDRTSTRSWSTAQRGLWGDTPYLSLHERWWDEANRLSTERFSIIHLEDERLTEVVLSHQSYSTTELTAMLQQAGFSGVEVHQARDILPLVDAAKWNVYLATR